MDIQSSFSRLPEFVYFFYKQIQADNLSSRCPQSQPIKQKIKRKVKTNNKSFDDDWRLKRLKVTVTKKEHEDLEMFRKMMGDKRLTISQRRQARIRYDMIYNQAKRRTLLNEYKGR